MPSTGCSKAGKRPFVIDGQLRKIGRQGGAPPDQHIIMSGTKCRFRFQPHHFAQPPAHAIALDRIADLFRNRESDPDRATVAAIARLQNESCRRDLDPARGCDEIRSFPEALHRGRRPDGAEWAAGSSAQTLATARAARSDDLAAALGRHAGAKAMPALAHELARLIGPFHGVSLRWSRRNAGCFGWCAPARSSANVRGRRCRIRAAYKGQGLVSSMRRDARAGSRRFIFRLIYQLHRADLEGRPGVDI